MNLETPVSRFKFSKCIAYILSIVMVMLVLLNWQDLTSVAWPIIILFVLTLIFNGGLGGVTIGARLPFYLAVIGFVLFLVLVFLSMM
jgi:hypothetical protein